MFLVVIGAKGERLGHTVAVEAKRRDCQEGLKSAEGEIEIQHCFPGGGAFVRCKV